MYKGHVGNVKRYLNMANIFIEIVEFKISFWGIEEKKSYKLTEKINLEMFANKHITNKHNLKNYPEICFVSSSYKFYTDKWNIFYTADLNDAADFNLFDLGDVDILISEITHVKPEEILSATKTLKIKKLYFTHIPEEIRENMAEKIKKMRIHPDLEIVIADDGMNVELK